jgi:hypothetical protein
VTLREHLTKQHGAECDENAWIFALYPVGDLDRELLEELTDEERAELRAKVRARVERHAAEAKAET